jgi:hypothetical protein
LVQLCEEDVDLALKYHMQARKSEEAREGMPPLTKSGSQNG